MSNLKITNRFLKLSILRNKLKNNKWRSQWPQKDSVRKKQPAQLNQMLLIIKVVNKGLLKS